MFGKKIECSICLTTNSSMWKKLDGDDVVCNTCYREKKLNDQCGENPDDSGEVLKIHSEVQKLHNCSNSKSKTNDDDEPNKCSTNKKENSFNDSSNKNNLSKEKLKKEEGDDDGKRELRRKTRKGKLGNKSSIPKGKGRRYIFKKTSTKSPLPVSVPITSESLMYKGQYYQIGDILSVRDVDGGKYYCQARGLLQDQYCEKSVVISWLLPTVYAPPPEEKFDPATYIIGPEEELPRKLEYFEFVCHAPSDYYKNSSAPYSTVSNTPQSCFVWGRMAPPQILPIEAAADIVYK